jgi:hypothetical protein
MQGFKSNPRDENPHNLITEFSDLRFGLRECFWQYSNLEVNLLN